MDAHEGMPKVLQVMFPVMTKVMEPLEVMHALETGATRYVDAVNREREFQEFKSGTFVASAHGVAGPVSDQATRTESRASQYADIFKHTLRQWVR